MRLKLLACEVFAREISAVLRTITHQVDTQFFSKGWHEAPCRLMQETLQGAIDRTGPGYDAIIMAYGLCRYGTAGLTARSIPLVIPRAHDCITILLGSRERYAEYQKEHPGTYYRSTGWLERGKNPEELRKHSEAEQHGLNARREELREKFGDANGEFLFQMLGDQRRNYDELTFIEMGIEPSYKFEFQSRIEAEQNGWRFEKISGSLRLVRDLLNGRWNADDFLVVAPGSSVRPTYDERIMDVEPNPA